MRKNAEFKKEWSAATAILILLVFSMPSHTQGQTSGPSAGSPLERRRAVRGLAEKGPAARDKLVEALKDQDEVVRRTALRALCEIDPKKALDYAGRLMSDPSAVVRQEVVEQLAVITPRSDQVTGLLVKGMKDPSPVVSRLANQALWPFDRTNIPIRQRKDVDHPIEVVKAIELPATGWKFMNDPQNLGHIQKWYDATFDDRKWPAIGIGKAWGEFGHKDIQTGWYRLSIKLPEKLPHDAAELSFGGVDENAWVWVNGIYIGQHAVGPNGWDQPFNLDVTKEVRWGKLNQITVRVTNTILAGGIWRPVRLEVIKIKR